MFAKERLPKKISFTKDSELIVEQYLGKGAFSRCYSLKCSNTEKWYAGKFLDKEVIEQYKVKHKISEEISLLKMLNHKNIVGFYGYVEDEHFIYIVMELCTNRSMSELLKRRKYVSVFEARYYMKQITAAVSYLHDNKVIHRDLKLANLFINQDMVIKLGDFGLAVKLQDGNTTRRTLCGTPNYIAPEVLGRRGHSYQVDIWALGCILYILLVGVAPFQTESLDETYKMIQECRYNLPSSVQNSTAGDFIRKTLQKDPKERPNIMELCNHHFLTRGFAPKKIPPSCCIMPPRTKTLLMYCSRKRKYSQRRSLSERNLSVPEEEKLNDEQLLQLLKKLKRAVSELILKPAQFDNDFDTENPSLHPFIWVNSWVDYSHKYGFAYRLNDHSVGALYNDRTTLFILPSGRVAHYIDNNGNWQELSVEEETKTESLRKKLKILRSFRKFMFESLRNAYEDSDSDEEPLTSLPILTNWEHSNGMVGMCLSNGTFQVNFNDDHIKLILCPVMEAVTILSNNNQLTTYEFSLLKMHGCNRILLNKMTKALLVIDRVIVEKEFHLNY